MSVVLVIPAYEPEPKLVELVEELLREKLGPVLVVDDGSASGKEPLFEEIRARVGALVLSHPENRGKGAALKTAFRHVLHHIKDATGVVTVDADGQHLPADAARVAARLATEPGSLILGARTFEAFGRVPLRSRLGNLLTRWVFRLLSGRSVSDTQTGLRGIPMSLLPALLEIRADGYELEMDMLLEAMKRRVPLREVPIATVYVGGNETSHFDPLVDSLRIYFVLFRSMLASLSSAATDFLVFSAAYSVSARLFPSVVLARLCGAVVGFLLSRNFVFKSRAGLSREVAGYALLWLTLLGLSYGLMLPLVGPLGVSPYLARISVDTALFIVSFLVQRHIVFRASLPALQIAYREI